MSANLSRILLPTLLALLLALAGCNNEKPTQEVKLQGDTMGTTYTVVVVDDDALVMPKNLQGQLQEELVRINHLMSTWEPGSQLSLFNQQKSTDWVPMSVEIIDLVRQARRISEYSDGAYDVAIGSISRLWGFGPGPVQNLESPSDDQIFMAMNNAGYQLVELSPYNNEIRKLAPEIEVDLSSIAKGYAVDKLGSLLESQGVKRYLVDIGGEIRTRGLAADGEPWLIGIEWPDNAGPATRGLAVEDAHIATSGDYRNFKIVDGKRVSHLLDGRTGYPISHGLASVTVMHGTTALADAWATALMAMGPEKGLALAKERELAVSFTVRAGDGFEVVNTHAFEVFLAH